MAQKPKSRPKPKTVTKAPPSKGKAKPKSALKKTVPPAAKTLPKDLPKAKAAPKTAGKAPVSFSNAPIVVPRAIKGEGSSSSALSSAEKNKAVPPPLPPYRLPQDEKTLAFFDRQKKRLLELRDHFLDQMQSVAQDNLRSRSENNEASAVGQHQADAGSDAYEKDFALSLLSQEQDALYEIEEALKRLDQGAYGVCEMSNKPIPHNRLEAIPFARFTIECQQQMEKENRGRRRWDTAPQFMDSAENFSDEEEESSDDDDKKKEKD